MISLDPVKYAWNTDCDPSSIFEKLLDHPFVTNTSANQLNEME